MTAAATASPFLFAPLWVAWPTDAGPPRGVLLLGLTGFGATMLVFSFVESLTAYYAERFLSGMFTASVTPVAGSARRLMFVNMAGIAGFMFGPMLE